LQIIFHAISVAALDRPQGLKCGLHRIIAWPVIDTDRFFNTAGGNVNSAAAIVDLVIAVIIIGPLVATGVIIHAIKAFALNWLNDTTFFCSANVVG
jgi:hypothetical protein